MNKEFIKTAVIALLLSLSPLLSALILGYWVL